MKDSLPCANTHTQNKADRVLGLDALRGLAAVGVVIYHYTSQYDKEWRHSLDFPWRFGYGAWGVQIFFVISGFVILMSLERSRSVIDFAVNRFCRLYPPYWSALLLTFLVVSTFGLPGREVSASVAIANFTMFHRAFGFPDVDGVYWTLHVELCFYVLMVMLFSFKLQQHLIPSLFALAIIGLLNSQYGWFSDWKGVWRFEQAWPLRRFLPYFLFGILLHRARNTGFRRGLFASFTACLILMCLQEHDGAFRPLIVAGITSGVVLLDPILLKHPVPIYLGTISYSLYLLHEGIGYVVIRTAYRFGLPGTVGVAIALILALSLASLNAFSIEKPVSNGLRRLWMSFTQRQPATELPAAG